MSINILLCIHCVFLVSLGGGCQGINERQSLSGFGVSYSLHSIPGWRGASHEYSRINYFTRTTNEPSRRQNSEVSTPNRLTVARHPPRTHIRSREVQTRQEYSRNYGRGHRFTPAQARGPIRAKGLQPHSLSGSKWKHTERILHLDRSYPYNLQAKIRLSRHPATIQASSSREPTHQGGYSSEVCQIEGAETSKPRQRTGLKSIGLTDLFT